MILNLKEGSCQWILDIPRWFSELPASDSINKFYKILWRNLNDLNIQDDDGAWYNGREAADKLEEQIETAALPENIGKVSPGFEFEQPHVQSRIRRALRANLNAWKRQKLVYERRYGGK